MWGQKDLSGEVTESVRREFSDSRHSGGQSSGMASASHEYWSSSLPLRKLLEEYGSPLYLIHENQLEENFNVLSGRQPFGASIDSHASGDSKSIRQKSSDRRDIRPVLITYPVKANYSPVILRFLAERGAQADCASESEVRWAIESGFTIDRIVYNTPAPDRSLLVDLLFAGATIVLDSLELLRCVSASAEVVGRVTGTRTGESRSVRGRVLLRVNPLGTIGYRTTNPWDHLVAHGDSQSKFGIPEEDISAETLRGQLPIDGLHIHVGTQMDHVAGWSNGIQVLHRVAKRIESAQQKALRIIDLGGGIAIPFLETDQYPPLRAYIEAAQAEMSPKYEYWIEPGHALVGNAVGLATTVCELKEVRGKRWGICDVGTDQLSRVTLGSWRHRVIREGGMALAARGPDSLGGPLCFAGDVLLPETDLSEVRRGDGILVQHVGAYCASASSRFNGRVPPGELVIRRDGKLQKTSDSGREFSHPGDSLF